VRFAEVGCVAEAEGGGGGWGGEGLGEFWLMLALNLCVMRRKVVRTTQQRQLPRRQPRILPELPMLPELCMSMARQIISVVILIRPHAFLALGPEPCLNLAPVIFFNRKVLVRLQVEICGVGDPVRAFALRVGGDGRVQRFEVSDELSELGGGDVVFGELGALSLLFWGCGFGRGVAWRGGLGVVVCEAARCRGDRARGEGWRCAASYPRGTLAGLQEQSPG
jgi:hypothetical protein